MNRIKLTLIVMSLMVMTSSCFLVRQNVKPSTTVKRLSDTISLRDGSLVYALPRTMLTIRAEFERTIEIPGPYARYAEELLGLDNVILSEGEDWSMV